MRRAYLKAPGEAGGATEELLVEVVADPSDCLRNQKPRGNRVHKARDAHARAAQGNDTARNPPRIPHQIPRPPCQIASHPHQLCGTSFQLVTS